MGRRAPANVGLSGKRALDRGASLLKCRELALRICARVLQRHAGIALARRPEVRAVVRIENGRKVGVDHASKRRAELHVTPKIDETRHCLAGRAAEKGWCVGEPILQVVCDIPSLVRDFAAVVDDRGEMLPAQATDSLDIGKPHRMDVEIDALAGERIPDSPGERTGPPPLKAYSLVEYQSHRLLCVLGAQRTFASVGQ